MTEVQAFERAAGRAPRDDDLTRAACAKAGKVGHYFCGWCVHERPRFVCEKCGPLVLDPKRYRRLHG